MQAPEPLTAEEMTAKKKRWQGRFLPDLIWFCLLCGFACCYSAIRNGDPVLAGFAGFLFTMPVVSTRG